MSVDCIMSGSLFLLCALSLLISYRHLADPRPILEALLHPQITNLPGHIQAVFVQNIVKLYASILVKAEAEVILNVHLMITVVIQCTTIIIIILVGSCGTRKIIYTCIKFYILYMFYLLLSIINYEYRPMNSVFPIYMSIRAFYKLIWCTIDQKSFLFGTAQFSH